MKKFNSTFSLFLILILSLTLGSCSSDKSADLREIFKTIPSDVSFVGVVDTEALLKEAGCKVKNGTVKPGKEIQKIFADTTDLKLKFISDIVLNGGIDPSFIVMFTEGYNNYVTGFLSDTDLFKELMEHRFGDTTIRNGEISTCGNAAFTSNRFWVCISSRNSINYNDIKHFTTMSEKQSFLEGDNSAKLVESDKIMRGWGDIKGTLNASGIDFSTKASVMMGLEALFEDAVEFQWDMEIEKNKLKADLTLINSKGGIAAFLYPTAKVDLKEITGSNLSGDALALMAISPKFTERMREDTRGKGMSVIGMLSGMIQDVAGTVMVAADNKNSISGMIPVKGNNTSDLNQLLAQYDFSVTQEKGAIRFTKGNCSGEITPEIVADVFKGKMGGLILSPESTTYGDIDYAAIIFNPEKGGMDVEIEVKANNKESLLVSLIEVIK